MRALRLAAPVQLPLPVEPAATVERWWLLPEPVRADVLVLLARLIARGLVVADGEVGDE